MPPKPMLLEQTESAEHDGGLPAQEVEAVEAVPPEVVSEDASPPHESEVVDPDTAERSGGDVRYVARSEDSELIVELALDDKITVLDQAFTAYQVDETILIPLGRFAELVDFPIKVDTGKGSAEGWFVKPENTFRLYTPYKSAEIAGKKITVAGGIAETHEDDIYVSLDLVTSWFPVELTLNYNELRLYLKPLLELPFQAKAQRRALWEAMRKTPQAGLAYDPKEIIRLPYRNYAAPTFEILHNLNHNRAPDGTVTATGHSLNAQTDLLGHSSRFNINYGTSTADREEVRSVQFSMEKEDYEANLLGPLRATRYELGDVSASPFPLAGQGSGRGFALTNEPYNFVRDPTQFRIEGFGPVGWDVEIFQDNQLLAFAPVTDDGRYEFTTLPLGEGFNLFKIVLYGPNGEQEVRYERFYLGQNMVEEGKFLYNASFLQSSTPLLDFAVVHPDETPHTLSLLGEYGITKYLSGMAGYFRGPQGASTIDGMGMGLRTSGGNTYAQINAFFDKSGGKSSSALVTGNLTETMSFNMQHRTNQGYDPDIYSTVRSTTASLTKIFDFENELLPDFNVTVQGDKQEEDTGRKSFAHLLRVSTNFLGLSLTNELERTTYTTSTPDVFDGRLSGRYRSWLGTMRGDLNYTYHNPFELKNMVFTLQRDMTDRVTLNTGLSHSFGDDPTTTLSTGLDWKLDKVRLGFTGALDNKKNRQIGMTVAYNLVPRTLYGDYAISGKLEDINSGRLLIRPFVDINMNGKFDEGEPLVRDVVFRNALRGTLSTMAEKDFSVLSGLSPNLANRISVEEKTLNDLFMTPAKKQIVVLGKTGINGPVDFAFNKLGSISGSVVTVNETGEEVPVENVHIILMNGEDKEVSDTYSEFDGYFSFESVPMGDYDLFFPASEALSQYYSGDGMGPHVSVSFEEPESADLKVIVAHDRIRLEGAEAPPEAENQEPVEKQSFLKHPLRFFALKLNHDAAAAQ